MRGDCDSRALHSITRSKREAAGKVWEVTQIWVKSRLTWGRTASAEAVRDSSKKAKGSSRNTNWGPWITELTSFCDRARRTASMIWRWVPLEISSKSMKSCFSLEKALTLRS